MIFIHISFAVDTAEPDHFFLHVSDGEEDKIFYLKKCEKKLQILEITEITLILSVIYNSYINFNSY